MSRREILAHISCSAFKCQLGFHLLPDNCAYCVPVFPLYHTEVLVIPPFITQSYILEQRRLQSEAMWQYMYCAPNRSPSRKTLVLFRFPKFFSFFLIHFTFFQKREEKKERVEQMASKWLKPPTMAPTTSSLSFSLHSPSFADYFFFSFSVPPPLPSTGFSHRCLFNAILAHNLCQRGSGSLEAPWSEHKVSQEEKERRGGGEEEEKKGRGERWG